MQRKRIATVRACGLSERKAEYIRDLARHFVSARLDPQAWPALDDEALIEALVDVKGIGRWTAEMFLMFHEMRANVLPVDDIGLQKAVVVPLRPVISVCTESQPHRSRGGEPRAGARCVVTSTSGAM